VNRRQQVFLLGLALLVALIAGATYMFMAPAQITGKIQLVASFYPLAYFSEEIGGDKVEVRTLIPYNTEVHSWQPSTADIMALADADIVVYNGADLDQWFQEDILPALNISGKIVVEAAANLTLITASGDTDEPGPYDPHTWISPHLAEGEALSIYNALVQKDPANAAYYNQRWQSLKERLEGLDASYTSGLANKTRGTIFVTHAAFGYLAYRYNFTQEGVIGISADQEPSAEGIAALVEQMVEHNTFFVFVDPVYSDQYALILKNELEARTGHQVQILELSLILGPLSGEDYIAQSEANLNNLKIGLGVP